MTSQEVRSTLVEALRLDLIGPSNDHAFASELLSESPARWYLSGFLVPSDAPVEQRSDETCTEEIDGGGEVDENDDGSEADRPAARRSYYPSSIGLSVLLAPGLKTLTVKVCWGDYSYEGHGEPEPAESGAKEAGQQAQGQPADGADTTEGKEPAEGSERRRRGWRRTPKESTVELSVPPAGGTPHEELLPGADGLCLVVSTLR